MPPKADAKKGKKRKTAGKNNQNKEKQALEMNEFNTLDEKIKSGQANEIEAKRFEELAVVYA